MSKSTPGASAVIEVLRLEAQALRVELDDCKKRTQRYAKYAGQVEGALRHLLCQHRIQSATEMIDVSLCRSVDKAQAVLAQKEAALASPPAVNEIGTAE